MADWFGSSSTPAPAPATAAHDLVRCGRERAPDVGEEDEYEYDADHQLIAADGEVPLAAISGCRSLEHQQNAKWRGSSEERRQFALLAKEKMPRAWAAEREVKLMRGDS